MNDWEIVELFLARDEEALKQVSKRYGARLRALALGILGDVSEAEECVNDTWLAVWRSIPPQEPKEYLFAYLARITRHLALDRCRARNRVKRTAHVVELTAELLDCIPAGDSAEARLDAKELAETVSTWLRTLPEEKRRLFLLRYWYCDPVSTLAKSMGWGESRVKTALHRLRKELREHLEKEGYL